MSREFNLYIEIIISVTILCYGYVFNKRIIRINDNADNSRERKNYFLFLNVNTKILRIRALILLEQNVE